MAPGVSPGLFYLAGAVTGLVGRNLAHHGSTLMPAHGAAGRDPRPTERATRIPLAAVRVLVAVAAMAKHWAPPGLSAALQQL